MSSRLHSIWLPTLLSISACAGFTRGDYWSDPDEEEEGDAADGSMDDSGESSPAESDASTGSESTGGGGLSYELDIHDLMVAGCERCHSPTGTASGTGYIIIASSPTGTYETTLNFVTPGEPEDSRLLVKASGMGHGGGAVYDTRSDEYATIALWIEEGALP